MRKRAPQHGSPTRRRLPVHGSSRERLRRRPGSQSAPYELPAPSCRRRNLEEPQKTPVMRRRVDRSSCPARIAPAEPCLTPRGPCWPDYSVTVGERLVRTQDAETESVRTIHGLLSVKNNSRDNQRARRRQERVGVAGGGTGECCSPGIIHWRGTNERITRR